MGEISGRWVIFGMVTLKYALSRLVDCVSISRAFFDTNKGSLFCIHWRVK